MEGAVGVALVGAGYWGSRLARNLDAAPAIELLHVCDVDAPRAHKIAAGTGAGARATTSLAAVLDDPAVTAVVLATPATTHAALLATVLGAGRHALVEKPLAMTAAAASELAARAAAADLIVMCDHTYRFAPVVDVLRARFARDATTSPVLAIESLRANHDHGQPDVDVFWDLAHHDLAILDAVLPGGLAVETVRAEAADRQGIGRAHRGDLWLDLVEGPSVHVRVDWCAPEKARTMTFTTTDGETRWDDLDPTGVLQHSGRQVPVPDAREPLARVVDELATAITEGRGASCGPVEELTVLTVLEAASASVAEGGIRVAVDRATTGGLPALP